MNFYTSLFGNSKPLSFARYSDAGPGPKGTVMTASFLLDKQEFVVLNGGSIFDQLENFQQLRLKKSIVSDCGIVLLNYKPK